MLLVFPSVLSFTTHHIIGIAPPCSAINHNFRNTLDLTTSETANAIPHPVEEKDCDIEMEANREYAEVAEYSVPRPSWLIMQASPPYANTSSLLAAVYDEPSYENTSYF